MASKDQLIRMMELSAPETMPEAALDHDGVRGIDVGEGLSLEDGIAAVFDEIRNGAGGESGCDEADPTPNGVTFALLTELNRLWERPPM